VNTLNSKDAQNHFGELIDSAQREPVMIERRGRPVAVVMSREQYEHFEAIEDELWSARAKAAAERGFAGPEETARAIEEILRADS
jgi:antitoxin Phd